MNKHKKSSDVLSLLAIGGLIGCLIGIAVGMGLLSYLYPIFQSGSWAAWVQAVGSVLAIIASALLVAWQLSQQKRRRDQLRFEEARSISKNLLIAIDMLENLSNSFIKSREKNSGLEDKTDYVKTFRIWYEGLGNITVFAGSVSELTITVLGLRSATQDLMSIAERYGNAEGPSGDCIAEVTMSNGYLEVKRQEIKKFADDLDLGLVVKLKGLPDGVSVNNLRDSGGLG